MLAVLFFGFAIGIPCIKALWAVVTVWPVLVLTEESIVLGGYIGEAASQLNWARAIRWEEVQAARIDDLSGDLIFTAANDGAELARVRYFNEFDEQDEILKIIGHRIARKTEKERLDALKPQGHCPNCEAVIPLDSEECTRCKASLVWARRGRSPLYREATGGSREFIRPDPQVGVA